SPTFSALLVPYTSLFRSADLEAEPGELRRRVALRHVHDAVGDRDLLGLVAARAHHPADEGRAADEQDREAHPERGLLPGASALRSEEHTSELQSREKLVC